MKKSNLLKKTLGLGMASALGALSLVGLTGCTTSRPELQIKFSFNDETYTLEYVMYRKLAPSTVTHFIELVEKNYYKDMVVHNYTSNKWYMGGYTYDAQNADVLGGLVEKDYFATVASYALTQTVWLDPNCETPANTVYGEFSSNGFKIDPGDPLAQSFGSLTMYYTAKTWEDGTSYKAWAKRVSDGGIDRKDYLPNSATSLFYMSVAATTSAASSDYCTFATLKSDSKKALNALKDAISEYITDQKEENEDYVFAPAVDEIPTDAGDPYTQDAETTYNVPLVPIIIKGMKIIKY